MSEEQKPTTGPSLSRCPHCNALIEPKSSGNDIEGYNSTNLALVAVILVAIGLFVLFGDGSAIIYGIPAILFGVVVLLVGKSLQE